MDKLANHFKQLQSTLPPDGPGFSAAVLRDGETVFELHHGMASLELKVPLSADSAYYLASESKQFTAACVMMLVREGVIGLDDDVCVHLPELAKFEQPFPLRSLLNHSSGIPDYFQFIACQLGRHEADYFDNRMILALIARLDTVVFPTSTEYGYSNSNYILLATLVERLGGMPLARFAREKLFAPLGMRRIAFDEDRFSIIEHRVFSYEADPARPFGYKQHLGNANTVGDGGVYGSVRELMLWEREWHRQWTDPSSLLHAMLQPSPLLDGTVPPYRFGLELIQRAGHDVVFHSGGLWGFDTLILRIPARRISIIQLANCEAAQSNIEGILAAILG
ncbi:serine hydrolase domain-containing protein [Telluria beijingensis]|uniref:serine hydrolase domain-containing protein n=1 Tax=Telluria beijingensis TaxID=3068633 RepID=UPI00279621EF|nr:serine hydrolase domain-containing protein [Massilia sp. REN29]